MSTTAKKVLVALKKDFYPTMTSLTKTQLEAIIAYLAWKNAKIGAGRYAWRIEGNYQKEYYNERRLAVARFKPFYIQEAYEADQIQNRLTIKV